MKKACDFLKECGVFYLATMEGDQPRVRPFGALAIFEDKLYIMTGNIKPVFAQISRNPKIEICACKGDTWIRITADAVIDSRFEARKAMLDQNPDLRAMYDENDGNIEVMYLGNAKAVLSSFVAAPEVWEF